jgi:YD repeat-containing protein
MRSAILFLLSLGVCVPSASAQDVNLRNANLFYTLPEVRVQKPGVALEIIRNYNSRSNVQGVFGYGWASNLDIVCQEGPDGSILVTDSDGYVMRFTKDGEPKENLRKAYVKRLVKVRREEDRRNGTERQSNWYADFEGKLNTDPDLRVQVGQSLPRAWADAASGSYISYDRGSERLTKRQDGSYLRVRSDGIRYGFDRLGKLRSFTDAAKRGMRLDYDRDGRLVKISHSEGGTISLKWNSDNRIVEILDTANRRIQYAYDDAGNLSNVNGPDERQIAYKYDNEHNLTAGRQPNGESFQVNYNTEKDWVTAIKIGEAVTAYSWQIRDADQFSVRVENPDGTTTTHHFDETAHTHTIEDAAGRTETLLSACCNKPLEVKDPSGRITRYDYDTQTRLVSVTYPDGSKVRWAYHPKWSKIMQAMYSDGRRFSYQYNDNGNLIQASARSGRQLDLNYGPNGKVSEITDKDGGVYQFKYDTSGRPTQIAKGAEGALRIHYGAAGEITSTEVSQGSISRGEFYVNLQAVLALLEPATGEE